MTDTKRLTTGIRAAHAATLGFALPARAFLSSEMTLVSSRNIRRAGRVERDPGERESRARRPLRQEAIPTTRRCWPRDRSAADSLRTSAAHGRGALDR